jgi:low temperature requirement protein LtrA
MPGSPFRRLTRPPRLRSVEERGTERHATWFELFFDLVFVLAIAQLAAYLEHHLTPAGFLGFAGLAVPVWWSWVVYTFYADRFDTDDLGYRLLMLLGMLAIAAMAVTIPDALGAGGAAFVAARLAVRAVPLLLYLRAGRYVPLGRRLARVYGTGSALAAVVWLASLAVGPPARFALWAVAVAIETLLPLATRRVRQDVAQARLHAEHIAERFGLLTIIVLGESVVAIGGGVAGTDWTPAAVTTAVAAFVVICSMWWVYFTFGDARLLERSPYDQHVFVYGHLPIVVGVTAAAAGCRLLIAHAGDPALGAGAAWAVGGGVALFLVAVTVIRGLLRRRLRDGAGMTRLGVALGVLALTGAHGLLAPAAFAVVLAVLLTGLLVSEVIGAPAPAGQEG